MAAGAASEASSAPVSPGTAGPRAAGRACSDGRYLRETALEADLGCAQANPEETASLLEKQRRVLTALETLSPGERQAIELAFFQGFTHSELAAKLGQPLGTVKSRIRQALLKLRDALSPGFEKPGYPPCEAP
jgi:RNA polymerase sigma-70 factor (ECF subfamily)